MVLNRALNIIAAVPSRKKKGKTGNIAPIENKKKDVKAASHAEPPSSSGSIPSSSRARVSRAVLGSEII
ncbi:hypothetical protein SDC9_98289 [bioreactor metagenome]|uniref:Uncharacterized protein n=1 Tax=bioreactor metagenome TaxID=1076179 RepID=A0A645AEF1_9ZZZZ